MKTEINTDQIAVIRLKDFTNSRYYKYVYKPKKTFLGFVVSEEVKGFCGGSFLPFYETKEAFLQEYGKWNIVDGSNVLVKPNIEFEMSNSEDYCRYFDSIEERDEFYNKHLKHLNLLAL